MKVAGFGDRPQRELISDLFSSSYIPHLINLSDHSIHHLPFKRAEDNGLVLHWVEDKTPPWLDYACTNVVNGGDCNDKAIPEKGTVNTLISCMSSFFIQE